MGAKGKRAKAAVFRGSKVKTSGGMTKDKLTKNKFGKIVSKAKSAASKKRFAAGGLKAWCDAVKAARKAAAMKAKKTTSMKAMKGMKVMKAKRVSIIAKGKRAKAAVFRGSKVKTSGGMTKDKLTKNKFGKIVSKAASARGKRNFANSGFKAWVDAVKA